MSDATNTPAAAEQLAPCPFCGNATAPTVTRFLTRTDADGIKRFAHRVECDDGDSGCGGHGPEYDRFDSAIAAWNRRKPAMPCGHPAASVASSDEAALRALCDELDASADSAYRTVTAAAREALTRRREADALRAERDQLRAVLVAYDETLKAVWGVEEDPYAYTRGVVSIQWDAALAATPPAAEAATPTSDEPRWLPAGEVPMTPGQYLTFNYGKFSGAKRVYESADEKAVYWLDISTAALKADSEKVWSVTRWFGPVPPPRDAAEGGKP